MALRRLARVNPLRSGVSWFSTLSASGVEAHVVSITIVDNEGLRHVVKGVEGQQLNDVLAADDSLRESVMVAAPHGRGAWDTHVFVTKEVMKSLPKPSAAEIDDLQDAASNLSPNSRMASGVTLSKAFDGAVIALGEVRPWMTL